MHLGDTRSILGFSGFVENRETDSVERSVVATSPAILACNVVEFNSVITFFHPGFSEARQPFVYIDVYIRVGVGPACVIHCDRWIWAFYTFAIFDGDCWILMDFSHCHLYRVEFPGHIFFCGIGI